MADLNDSYDRIARMAGAYIVGTGRSHKAHAQYMWAAGEWRRLALSLRSGPMHDEWVRAARTNLIAAKAVREALKRDAERGRIRADLEAAAWSTPAGLRLSAELAKLT